MPQPSLRDTLSAIRDGGHWCTAYEPGRRQPDRQRAACLGASPLMAEAEAEMPAVAGFADALLVNLGMQTPPRIAAAQAAIALAAERGTPWVLDPVAAGAIPARTDLALALAARAPRLIKGNASEILALAGAGHGGRGTDATHPPVRRD